jgi:hypothetical protein
MIHLDVSTKRFKYLHDVGMLSSSHMGQVLDAFREAFNACKLRNQGYTFVQFIQVLICLSNWIVMQQKDFEPLHHVLPHSILDLVEQIRHNGCINITPWELPEPVLDREMKLCN